MAAIECSLIAMMKTITDSPHGAEILDMKNSLAGDLAAVWRDALRQSFGAAIAAEAARNKVDLAARGLIGDGACRPAARRARRHEVAGRDRGRTARKARAGWSR